MATGLANTTLHEALPDFAVFLFGLGTTQIFWVCARVRVCFSVFVVFLYFFVSLLLMYVGSHAHFGFHSFASHIYIYI